ncbi:unnamed protein product [Agarophyton chilense]
MRGSSSSIVSPETEYGGRDFVRKPDAFRRKSVDTSGDLGLLAVPPSTAMNKTKCRSAVTYWSRVIEFFTQPSVFSYLLFGLLFHIVFEQFSAQFSILNIHKRRQDEALVPRYSNSFIPLSLPKEPNITLLTTGFEGYSPARQKELYLVAFRNINLGFQQYHRLCDPRCAHIHSTDTKTSFKNMKGQVTYRHLFEEANKFIGSIVVIANADIYFDHSIYCAGLLHERAVLALSRHPSPDCISSARGPSGREPLDFCGGYDPKFAASHDGPPVMMSLTHVREYICFTNTVVTKGPRVQKKELRVLNGGACSGQQKNGDTGVVLGFAKI